MPVFTIHASKGGQSVTTVRIGLAATVAKAEGLIQSGWQVRVTDAAGRQYGYGRFDVMLRDNWTDKKQ